jgi:hypothetical protein
MADIDIKNMAPTKAARAVEERRAEDSVTSFSAPAGSVLVGRSGVGAITAP